MTPTKYPLRILLFFSAVFFYHTAHSNNAKDSAARVLHNLSEAYQKGKLPEKTYLDTVYATMRNFLSCNIFFTNKELLEMLATYRKAAWSPGQDWKSKRRYYGILSNQAQMTGRDGEMLYYGEKIDKLERAVNNRQSLTALTIIAGYYETQRSIEKIKDLYESSKSYLNDLPAIIDKQKLNENDLVQAASILDKSARALYELKDTIAGAEAEMLLGKTAALANARYKGYKDVLANIASSQIMALYSGAIAKNRKDLILESFKRMDELLSDKNTPDYLKPTLYFIAVDWKVAFYLYDANINIDSASHYLNIYEERFGNSSVPYSRFLLTRYKTRLLYRKGKYRESADLYETAIDQLDSARSVLVKDIDDMMYARAETEEQQLLLAEAAARNRKTEMQLLIASIMAAVLLIGGVLTLQYTRRKQKAKLLEFKLNMARNIHDETNPALLYAKALIKASRSDTNREQINAELGSHIDHTMELIRSLSHDLKSDKQYMLHDLVAKTEQTLGKLNTGDEFTFDIQTSIDKKRFISHYQFSQLTSVLNECITNTIRHASFNKMNITFTNKGNKLTITYNDNGKGWEMPGPGAGIGIKNMEERVRQINGDWKIDNDYPNGYRISISSLLR